MVTCSYCGEKEGIISVSDPNGGEENWLVCKTCEDCINHQMNWTLGKIIEETIKKDLPKSDLLIELRQHIILEEIEIKKLGGFTASISKD